MQLNLARKGNGLNGGWHKSAIAILMKGVLDKGRCWKDDKSGNIFTNRTIPIAQWWDDGILESAFSLMLSF